MTEASGPDGAALSRFNQLSEADARRALSRCCGATRWIDALLGARPFASADALFERADAVWRGLERADHLEAFSHHPEIGADLNELRRRFAGTADLSQSEQAGVTSATESTLRALRESNRAYRERFGYCFIVCATGKSADDMLAILQERLGHAPEAELCIAADEQAKITRLRLEKICQ
jgi:2-oxo-4-hydroxy-4-carboxy-5-ureidoimidazoline decarboxylase